MSKRKRKLKPKYAWCFRTEDEIYWTTLAATEQICRALHYEYHACGWKCVRVKVSVARDQSKGRLPRRFKKHMRHSDIVRTAWPRPGLSGDGFWKMDNRGEVKWIENSAASVVTPAPKPKKRKKAK